MFVKQKRPYEAWFPAVKCWREEYDALKAFAAQHKVSMGEVIRQAVAFFLRENSRQTEIENVNQR